jgi:hypothetical protein
MDWYIQLCLALGHLHDKKILHRVRSLAKTFNYFVSFTKTSNYIVSLAKTLGFKTPGDTLNLLKWRICVITLCGTERVLDELLQISKAWRFWHHQNPGKHSPNGVVAAIAKFNLETSERNIPHPTPGDYNNRHPLLLLAGVVQEQTVRRKIRHLGARRNDVSVFVCVFL